VNLPNVFVALNGRWLDMQVIIGRHAESVFQAQKIILFDELAKRERSFDRGIFAIDWCKDSSDLVVEQLAQFV
jgi:hypothetical protein